MDRVTALTRLPILAQFASYRLEWLRFDIAAGLSVAAVSLPSAIAYPAIAHLPTQVGLFATIFSMAGYALFGPSRQLMVGPDTGTCIMLASVLATLGPGGEVDRVSLTLLLSLTVGLLCFLAGALRLGFLGNFLSRPMLVGFLAGISISLIISQITRLTAVEIETSGLIRPIAEFAAHAGETHLPTIAMGLGTLFLLRVLRHAAPSVPAPLIAVLAGIAVSAAFDLESRGVAILGPIPEIAFDLSWPSFRQGASLDFLGGALAIMVVGFGSGIVTARSFAMKNRSAVNADNELFGFGAANVASGLFGGFPVTASDSRTAVNFAIGGKTQLVSLIAAATLAVIILYVADVLAYLPSATLGAILVSAAIDLIDLAELRALRRMSRSEFNFALTTLFGVVIVGVLEGVIIAIAATLAYMLWSAAHPRLALLGRIPGSMGLYKLHRYPEAQPIPGLTVVVLQSGLVFFNADFVKQRLLKIARATRATERWFILDAAAVNVLDSTGVEALEDVRAHLAERGVAFGIADLNSRSRRIVEHAGLQDRIGKQMIFPSAEAAVAAFDALPESAKKAVSSQSGTEGPADNPAVAGS